MSFSGVFYDFLAKSKWLLILGFFALAGCQTVQQNSENEIEIFHTNDMHSHFAGSKNNNACIQEEGCVGGYGAIQSYVQKARKKNPDLLFLDAGDKFQGSLLYINYQSPLVSQIDNLMSYDLATLGNHEFDEGCKKLSEFIKNSNYSFIASNLKPEKGCPLRETSITPYLIKNYRNQKIGFIGIANPNVVYESSACKHTKFIDPIQAVSDAVKSLKSQNTNIIVVLSHMGLPFDQNLAKEVKGLDIIVGGHSHDYIGPGSPIGAYPLVEKSPDGQPVLIVTTSGEAKYLGHLKVKFNDVGIPISWSGEPIEIEQAGGSPQITQIINEASDEIFHRNALVIGENHIEAYDGLTACRHGSCLSASLITQAMLDYAKSKGAEIAMLNGGSIRGALPHGEITKSDLDNLQPFKDILEIRQYSGKQIREAIEHGVSDQDGIGPRIIHSAGLRYTYKPKAPVGKRVVSIEVLDESNRWIPLNLNRNYIVATNTFLSSGGDKHHAMGSGKLVAQPKELISEIFARWITLHSPLEIAPEPRIKAIK